MKPDPEHHFISWTVPDTEGLDSFEKTEGHSETR